MSLRSPIRSQGNLGAGLTREASGQRLTASYRAAAQRPTAGCPCSWQPGQHMTPSSAFTSPQVPRQEQPQAHSHSTGRLGGGSPVNSCLNGLRTRLGGTRPNQRRGPTSSVARGGGHPAWIQSAAHASPAQNRTSPPRVESCKARATRSCSQRSPAGKAFTEPVSPHRTRRAPVKVSTVGVPA